MCSSRLDEAFLGSEDFRVWILRGRRDGGMPLSIPPVVCAVGGGRDSRVIHRLP